LIVCNRILWLKTGYQRLVRRLALRTASQPASAAPASVQLDVAKRSIALQAVIFSIAVQYGPNTSLVRDALGGLGDLATHSDESVIRKLYEYRDKVEQYFP
jgi:hypothetical protein